MRYADVIEELAVAQTAEEFTLLMTGLRAAMGYATFTYASLRPTENKHGAPIYLSDGMVALSDCRPEWVQHYMGSHHHMNDPILRASLSQTLPVVWDTDFMAGDRSSGEDAMMKDAAEWGLRHGLTVTVRSCTGTLGMLSMTSPGFVAVDAALAGLFHLTAVHLHEQAQLRLAAPEDQPVALTPRELDVLMWSADGKAASDIAIILSLSTSTVNAHLSSAMRKLGVYSKTHAVARFLTSRHAGA